MKLNKQFFTGVGLLELMLSLAIIAILLIMATRYYQSASENNKRNQAVDMFSAVNGAVQTWKIDQLASSSGGPGTTVTIENLVSGGYLPPSYGNGSGIAPWGGTITVGAPSGGIYTVAMDSIPENSCSAVCGRVSSTIAAAGALQSKTGSDAYGSATCTATTTCTANYLY